MDIVEKLKFHGRFASETNDEMQRRKRNEREEGADEIEALRKERDELVAAAELLLSRKRPGAKEDDPRLILEIDCMNLEDVLAKVKERSK